jgi:hypothetical protein
VPSGVHGTDGGGGRFSMSNAGVDLFRPNLNRLVLFGVDVPLFGVEVPFTDDSGLGCFSLNPNMMGFFK